MNININNQYLIPFVQAIPLISQDARIVFKQYCKLDPQDLENINALNRRFNRLKDLITKYNDITSKKLRERVFCFLKTLLTTASFATIIIGIKGFITQIAKHQANMKANKKADGVAFKLIGYMYLSVGAIVGFIFSNVWHASNAFSNNTTQCIAGISGTLLPPLGIAIPIYEYCTKTNKLLSQIKAQKGLVESTLKTYQKFVVTKLSHKIKREINVTTRAIEQSMKLKVQMKPQTDKYHRLTTAQLEINDLKNFLNAIETKTMKNIS